MHFLSALALEVNQESLLNDTELQSVMHQGAGSSASELR